MSSGVAGDGPAASLLRDSGTHVDGLCCKASNDSTMNVTDLHSIPSGMIHERHNRDAACLLQAAFPILFVAVVPGCAPWLWT